MKAWAALNAGVFFQLLSTAERSTLDVKGLHAKLDRKRNVESENESLVNQFQRCFQANIESMESEVTKSTAEQMDHVNTIHQCLGKILAETSIFSILLISIMRNID